MSTIFLIILKLFLFAISIFMIYYKCEVKDMTELEKQGKALRNVRLKFTNYTAQEVATNRCVGLKYVLFLI